MFALLLQTLQSERSNQSANTRLLPFWPVRCKMQANCDFNNPMDDRMRIMIVMAVFQQW